MSLLRAARRVAFVWLGSAVVAIADPREIVSAHREQQVQRAALHHAEEALAYVDKAIDNVEDVGPDVTWDNDEVLEMLDEVRSLLLTGRLPTDHAKGSTR